MIKKSPPLMFSAIVMFSAIAMATAISPNVNAAENKDRPFKATLSILEQLVPGAPCSFATGYISGTGHATHLGNVSLSSQDCFAPFDRNTFTFTSHQVALTSANGDQIFATYSGTLTVPTGGAVNAILGVYTIYGGTGRFTGAAGVGTVSGVEDISKNPARGQLELSGGISY